MKLSAPLRIAEIAELLSWSHKKTKNWLWAKHVASGMTLLQGGPDPTGKAGPSPYYVTLAALRRVEPDLFEPPPGLEARVDANDERTDELERQVHQVATLAGILRRRLDQPPKGMLRVAAA